MEGKAELFYDKQHYCHVNVTSFLEGMQETRVVKGMCSDDQVVDMGKANDLVTLVGPTHMLEYMTGALNEHGFEIKMQGRPREPIFLRRVQSQGDGAVAFGEI